MQISERGIAYVVSSMTFIVLVHILYIDTNIGLVSFTDFYKPIYAPLWLESLVTIIFLPIMVYFSVYDSLVN